MSTTLIFGGSGKVARHLTKLLSAEPGATVYSIIRNPAQEAELKELGASPIIQSVEDALVTEITATIEHTQPDAIVWSAGAGGGSAERTKAVDHEGAVKVFDAFAAATTGKPKRFVMVSAVDVRDRESKPTPDWYKPEDVKRSEAAWKAIGTYYKAKLAADKDLVSQNGKRGLDYTILRPGSLSTELGTGKVRAGKVGMQGEIPREDVAGAILACLRNKDTIGLAFDLLGPGEGDLTISEAIAKVGKNKEDTFEGYH
ncbi:unnamed protein product [Parascedosporium putredinis]|uniref:NAD(P)-binding domain-containing protein n=1 Tax=Parascedosporium putredinis TaxID=1442378 RepID=A0A9P1M9Q1_9PEZI|nr:unnamed protein product [Parascedosporium putredinis]CAI7991232.1 unnamed protein product [Parascedosporium putredinis]